LPCHYHGASRGGCSLKQKMLHAQRQVVAVDEDRRADSFGSHRTLLQKSAARQSLALPETRLPEAPLQIDGALE
jgi:hypothetical protein